MLRGMETGCLCALILRARPDPAFDSGLGVLGDAQFSSSSSSFERVFEYVRGNVFVVFTWAPTSPLAPLLPTHTHTRTRAGHWLRICATNAHCKTPQSPTSSAHDARDDLGQPHAVAAASVAVFGAMCAGRRLMEC